MLYLLTIGAELGHGLGPGCGRQERRASALSRRTDELAQLEVTGRGEGGRRRGERPGVETERGGGGGDRAC